jgi:hypothetical protein
VQQFIKGQVSEEDLAALKENGTAWQAKFAPGDI